MRRRISTRNMGEMKRCMKFKLYGFMLEDYRAGHIIWLLSGLICIAQSYWQIGKEREEASR